MLSALFSIVLYMSSILFVREYFDLSAFTMEFLIKEIIITGICWLPVHLLKKIIEKVSPSEETRIKED